MMKWLRNKIISYLTKNLLKATTIDDIILISGRDWLVNKRKLSQGEMIDLIEEAKSFQKSELYKLMIKDLKYGMTLQRYDKATTADDMIFGKAMAYAIAQIELFINRISSL